MRPILVNSLSPTPHLSCCRRWTAAAAAAAGRAAEDTRLGLGRQSFPAQLEFHRRVREHLRGAHTEGPVCSDATLTFDDIECDIAVEKSFLALCEDCKHI